MRNDKPSMFAPLKHLPANGKFFDVDKYTALDICHKEDGKASKLELKVIKQHDTRKNRRQ